MHVHLLRLPTKSLMVTLASSCISLSAFAADLYVSNCTAPSQICGNDSFAGTPTAPLKTIQRAANLAKEGTTVHVAPGTYKENIITRANGKSSARVRYVSDTKRGAKIIGSGTDFVWINKGDYTDIVGFDISGSGRGGIANEGGYTLVANNYVHNMTLSGGCTSNGGAGIVNSNYVKSDGDIIGNVVHDIGKPGGCNGVQGIYSSNLRGRILNNIVYRASSHGIHLWHAASHTDIINNTVFANGAVGMGSGIVVGNGDAPGGTKADYIRVSNNIVFNNPNAGISEYCYRGENCIGPNNTYANNLVRGNGTGIVLKIGSATGTVTADPQFVNYQANGSGDYSLKSTSPAIDAGSTTSAPSTDIVGTTRPQGVRHDIGAYEYVSGATTTTAKPTTTTTTTTTLPKPIASLSTNSLVFASQTIGTTSALQLVTLKNVGNAAMTSPSGFSFTGDFDFGGTGTCKVGVSYAPGASCTASVVFKPSAAGTRTGTLTMMTNASPNPMVVKLSGTGVSPVPAPIASVSPMSLVFASQTVGTTSGLQIVTLTNSGNAAMTIPSGFVFSGDYGFGGTGTCKVGVSYAPGDSCTASVVFKPTAMGTRTGTLTMTTNASSTPIAVTLSGTGK